MDDYDRAVELARELSAVPAAGRNRLQEWIWDSISLAGCRGVAEGPEHATRRAGRPGGRGSCALPHTPALAHLHEPEHLPLQAARLHAVLRKWSD